MFERLQNKLSDTFAAIGRKGLLRESDVKDAMRDIRLALLEADVALPVAKEFVAQVQEAAVGEKVIKSIKPDQMIIKIVHDALVRMLNGADDADAELNMKAQPPLHYMVVGLQGVGKTTSVVKLAKHLTEKHNKKVLLTSLDVYRPAAEEQLLTLAEQAGIDAVKREPSEKPLAVAKRVASHAKKQGFDIVLFDTAGRSEINAELMDEISGLKKALKPQEVLLVADAMMGQAAVNIADSFHQALVVTGIVLTRVDGDARGGAALSMRQITGQPIKFMGVGEKLEDLMPFDAERIANRLLGQGDIVALVEKAQEHVDEQAAQDMMARLQKGQFDLDDFMKQMQQMRKLASGSGGLAGLMNLIPGLGGGKMKKLLQSSQMDDKTMTHQIAIIQSMTPHERQFPQVIKAKRKERIAKGSGVPVMKINRLLKQFMEMQKMMKKMGKMGGLGADMLSPEMAEAMGGSGAMNPKDILKGLGQGGADLPPDLAKLLKL